MIVHQCLKFVKRVHPHSICKLKYVVCNTSKKKVSAESSDLVNLLFKKRI